MAPSAVQLLPPGTLVQEAELHGGGFIRASSLEILDDGVRLRTPAGWREISGIRASGPARPVRLWLGTDHQGRSLSARTVAGARTSMLVAFVATLVAVMLGTVVGLASGLAPPLGRGLIRAGTDGLLGLPRVLLLLMLGVLLRGSPAGVGLAIGLASWMDVSRLVEAESGSLRNRAFVSAATASGVGRLRLAWRHLLPNLTPILAVVAPLVATEAILLESTLSFLGVAGGAAPSWGRMVADGQRLLPGGWWLVFFPGVLLSVTALAVHRLAQPRRDRSLGRPANLDRIPV